MLTTGNTIAVRYIFAETTTPALGRVRRLTGSVIEETFVDRGYRGHSEEESSVYISKGTEGDQMMCY